MEKVAELVTGGWSQQGIADEYGVTKGTVGSHVNRAVKTGLIERVGYGKYAVADGKPEAPEAPAKAESPAEESELRQVGEWILDFDARLRKVETRLADGLEGIADKLGDMQGSMIALRQAHIVTSQSVGGIKEQLEQTRLASPDYTDRLLTILETQQAIMASMVRGRGDADQS